MLTSDMSFTFVPFKTYRSLKWTNDLALTEKIWIRISWYLGLTMNIIYKKKPPKTEKHSDLRPKLTNLQSNICREGENFVFWFGTQI